MLDTPETLLLILIEYVRHKCACHQAVSNHSKRLLVAGSLRHWSRVGADANMSHKFAGGLVIRPSAVVGDISRWRVDGDPIVKIY